MMLRGPHDPDHYRTQVGRYRERWYIDPLPACPVAPATDQAWPSITTTKPPFANHYHTMRKVADIDDLEWRRLAGVGPDARYDAIKSNDRQTSRLAMDRGSIVHEWAEDIAAGRGPRMILEGYHEDAAKQAEPYLPHLSQFFDDWQPQPVATEVVCINRTLHAVGYAGTADLIARIDGKTWLIDWKSRTSSHAAYLEEAAQVAGYAQADYIIALNDDGEPCRQPMPDLDGGLIVSIRPDGYRVYPVDVFAARRTYNAMHAWWAAQRDHDSIGHPWQPRTVTVTESEPRPDQTPTPEGDAPQTSVPPSGFGSGLTTRIGELRTRLEILCEFTDYTKQRLAAEWPFNAPLLGEQHHHEHTDDTLDALDRWITGLEKQERIEVGDVAEYIARIEALPADIRQNLAAQAKAIGTPNLRTGRVTLRELDRLEPLIYEAEKAAKQRLTKIVDALHNLPESHADSLMQWATEDRPEPLQTADADQLAQLTDTETVTLIDLAARYQRPATEEETA